MKEYKRIKGRGALVGDLMGELKRHTKRDVCEPHQLKYRPKKVHDFWK